MPSVSSPSEVGGVRLQPLNLCIQIIVEELLFPFPQQLSAKDFKSPTRHR